MCSVALTRELISRAHPVRVADDPAAMRLRSDDEIAASLDETLAHQNVTNELWVFAYGSLMWKPDLDFAKRRVATVRGWHRRFCLWQWRFRGTREKPGIMLALDRGGSCVGIAYKVIGPDLRSKIIPVGRGGKRGNGDFGPWGSAITGESPGGG